MARNSFYGGNTARTSVGPVNWNQKSQRELEEERKAEARRNAAQKNRKRSIAIKTKFMAFISVSAIAIAAAAVVLIQAQASVTSAMKRVASLESQLTDLRAENDAKYNEIITSIDLNYIKTVAMEELGMKYATEDQIEYYTVDKNNFMDQYSDIPK